MYGPKEIWFREFMYSFERGKNVWFAWEVITQIPGSMARLGVLQSLEVRVTARSPKTENTCAHLLNQRLQLDCTVV